MIANVRSYCLMLSHVRPLAVTLAVQESQAGVRDARPRVPIRRCEACRFAAMLAPPLPVQAERAPHPGFGSRPCGPERPCADWPGPSRGPTVLLRCTRGVLTMRSRCAPTVLFTSDRHSGAAVASPCASRWLHTT
jgi:hypothetical protein